VNFNEDPEMNIDSKIKTLVIVPAYNESESIRPVLSDLREHFPEGDIIVINDGSSDDTSSVARADDVTVIDLPYNLGIGGAVQTGIKYAMENNYDIAIQFDGDGQHKASEINNIVKPVHEGADMVIGSRFLNATGYSMSFSRKLGSMIFAGVMSLTCGQKFTDTTSGFRAYSKNGIKLFSDYYPEDYPEVEALIVAYKSSLNIEEVPVSMRQRKGGRSSITALRSIYYMIKVLLAIFIGLLRRRYVVS
jgi:glycosyltransferase involved in cell wall biosynthesis